VGRRAGQRLRVGSRGAHRLRNRSRRSTAGQPGLHRRRPSDVFAIGDMMSLNGLPGQSPVAMQGGRHVAAIASGKRAAGTPFQYRDKGSMAIINRFHAITRVGKIELTGFIAWILWLAVHLVYLVGFRKRYVVVVSW